MKPNNSHSVDEELVTAYIDGDASVDERLRVEAAMAADEQVAWEVNTLRQTVELLQEVPSVPLPRSFTLTEDQVEDVLQARRGRVTVDTASSRDIEPPADTAWQRFLRFLNGGDLALRNAAALAAVLLLLVYVAESQMLQPQLGNPPADSSQLSSAPSTPQIQVTAVGGSISPQAEARAEEPSTEEQVGAAGSSTASEESGDGQKDDEPQFGVMSAGDEEQKTVDSVQEPAAAEAVQPETSDAAAAEQQLSASESEDPSNQSLLTVFRYARFLLVLAVIALWLLSRTRSRSGRARTSGS